MSNLPPLRPGVSVVSTPAGLLAHDPDRWLLFKAPHGLPQTKLAAWLGRSQLLADSLAPPVRPRSEQWFRLAPAWVPSSQLEARPGARYSCAACSANCRDLQLGPLLRSDVETLLSLPLGEERAGDGLFARRDGSALLAAEAQAAPDDVFLRKQAGACSLLLPDGLCSIHARFGVENKPQMCRLFPFEYLATPRALRVAMRLEECASAERTLHGQRVEEQLPELAELFPRSESVRFVPPRLWLAPGRQVGFDELLERLAGVERELGAAVTSAALPLRERQAAGSAPWMGALFRMTCDWAGAVAPHRDPAALERLLETTLDAVDLPNYLRTHTSLQRRPPTLYVLSRRDAARPAGDTARASREILLSPEALELERRLVADDAWSLRMLHAADLRAGAAALVLCYALSRRLAGRLAVHAGAECVRAADLTQAQMAVEAELEPVAGASLESLAALALAEARE